MALLRLLQDEIATHQEAQCSALGEFCADIDDEDDEQPAWDSDPFDIIAAREEEQGHPFTRN